MSCKNHIDVLMSKLIAARYAIKAVESFMSQDALRMIHFPYVHSVMTYGIIFGGNLSYSSNIFKIQKRLITVITNSRSRDYCRGLL